MTIQIHARPFQFHKVFTNNSDSNSITVQFIILHASDAVVLDWYLLNGLGIGEKWLIQFKL